MPRNRAQLAIQAPPELLERLRAVLLIAVFLAGCSAENSLDPQAEAKRLAFCRTVIDAVKPGDKLCGPYLQQIEREKEQREMVEAKDRDERALYLSLNIPEKCKKMIGNLMGRPVEGMVARHFSGDIKSAIVAYSRDDGTVWTYECKTDGQTMVWRALNISERELEGRWREEDRVPLSSL
jgi:hypothetical protein